MIFDPKTKKYPFPEDTASHYLVVKKNDGTAFDADYPYYDGSRKMRIKQALTRLLLYCFVFPVAKVRLGLKVRGRENLKKHEEEIAKGVVSCSNHVHLWDFISIMYGVRGSKPYVLTWATNIRGENGKMMRAVRCVPIPDNDLRGLAAMNRETREQLKNGSWIHIYSEGSMWEYYAPIRPFRDGAAYYSCETGRPILPIAFSYRRPGAVRRVLFRQIALFTLNIGEPIYPDPSLAPLERRTDLTRRSHEAVCRLAGIAPEENVYPPIYDNSRRVDYYD